MVPRSPLEMKEDPIGGPPRSAEEMGGGEGFDGGKLRFPLEGDDGGSEVLGVYGRRSRSEHEGRRRSGSAGRHRWRVSFRAFSYLMKVGIWSSLSIKCGDDKKGKSGQFL